MQKMSKTYVSIIAIMAAGLLVTGLASPNEKTVVADVVIVTTSTSTTTTTVESVEFVNSDRYEPSIDTTTTSTTVESSVPPIVPNEDVRCPQYWDTARMAGWSEDLLVKLDKIIFRESSCNFDSHNPYDPAGGSYGLTQINGYWCTSNKYNPSGWLQAKGIINTCQDLYDPLTNLKAALALFEYSLNKHGCGWSPWRSC